MMQLVLEKESVNFSLGNFTHLLHSLVNHLSYYLLENAASLGGLIPFFGAVSALREKTACWEMHMLISTLLTAFLLMKLKFIQVVW